MHRVERANNRSTVCQDSCVDNVTLNRVSLDVFNPDVWSESKDE